jgi:hypothetical protein
MYFEQAQHVSEMLIRSIKYSLIIKLITQAKTIALIMN